MARTENQKRKLLLIRSFLLEKTDEDHPVSMAAILAMLEEQGISAERKSVYADLDALREDGMDIVQSKGGYALASRTFELPELKLLVDAVQASRFITERKSRELISKLQTLCSQAEASRLNRNIAVSGRGKTLNESIYYNVDALQNAITDNQHIRFRYFDWAPDGSRAFREGTYEADPIALCWDDEYYYLIAETEKHGITHYRVDKMLSIQPEGWRSLSRTAKNLDLAAYTNRVFGMFSGEVTRVRLRFDNSLSGVVHDRFGADAMLIPDGEDHFILSAEVAVSPLFFSWVMMFGARAELLSPDWARAGYLALLHEAEDHYK